MTNTWTTKPASQNPMTGYSKWTVSMVLDNPHGELPVITNAAKGVIINKIQGSDIVLGFNSTELALTLNVMAPDHRTAAAMATAACDEGLDAAELKGLVVADCHTMRTDRLRSQNARIPDLVGVSEIAQIFGLSKQAAWQHTRKQSFPAAACQLKAGRLWLRSDVLAEKSRADHH